VRQWVLSLPFEIRYRLAWDEGELRTEWERLRETMTINEIEEFADRMQILGGEYGYPPLASWGENLQTQASMFQLDALPKTMDGYLQLIESIKS